MSELEVEESERLIRWSEDGEERRGEDSRGGSCPFVRIGGACNVLSSVYYL